MISVYTCLILFLLSFFFTWCFKFYAIKHNLLDYPNHRSSHITPKIRGAGVIFVILWLLYLLCSYYAGLVPFKILLIILPGSLLVAIIGFIDDHYSMTVKWRFIGYLIAALISLILLGGFSELKIAENSIHLGIIGSLLTVITIIWSINLYNFMDGIDGIAAVEALFVFGIGGYLLWQVNSHDLASLAWALCVLILGFLTWNFPPAKVFMGDVGSVFLGFLIVIFAMIGEKQHNVPSILWLMLYGIFVFDTSITLIRRFFAGHHWYEAHRLHAYQRLQSKNWGHLKILSGVIIVNSVIALLVLTAYYWPKYLLLLFSLELILLIVVYLLIEKKSPMLE